jgi:hypothetical protein
MKNEKLKIEINHHASRRAGRGLRDLLCARQWADPPTGVKLLEYTFLRIKQRE